MYDNQKYFHILYSHRLGEERYTCVVNIHDQLKVCLDYTIYITTYDYVYMHTDNTTMGYPCTNEVTNVMITKIAHTLIFLKGK